MSFTEKKGKIESEIRKITSENPKYVDGDSNNEFRYIQDSHYFGDVKVKYDGTMLFSDEYPQVKLRDLEFKDKLGEGAQGVVFSCIHIPSGKEFVVKSITVSDKSSLQRTIDEIHSLRVLRNPYIVNLYSAFYQNGKIHILMDLINGASLGDYIKLNNKIPEAALGRICWQVLSGLFYLWRMHYLHGDLKLNNIIVSCNGSVKIADFELARLSRNTRGLTHSILGTTCYMSPERISREEYNIKCDVWSLGVIIYRCSMGRFPFGEKETNFQSIYSDNQGDYEVLLDESFSQNATDFVTRCLQVDQEKRAGVEELISHSWMKEFSNKEDDALVAWISDAEKLRKSRERK